MAVVARPVQRLVDAVDHKDDWMGRSDPIARRKIQNRLNQRARRKFLPVSPQALVVPTWATARRRSVAKLFRVISRRTAPEKWTPLRSKIADIAHGHQIAPSFTSASNQYPLSVGEASPLLVLKPVVMELSAGYFPLSSDHLIHLIQFNVFRAMLTNMFTLRITNLFECEEKVSEQMRISQLPLPAGVPPSLEPTALQRQVPHAPYVDLFPLASLRDTLVRAEGMYDDCELCVDLLGAISGPQVGGYSSSNEGNDDHRKGLVVWGEPWQVDSWEVEEGFVKKWGWMLKDNCEDLIRSTNRWRQVRGDEPLRWTDWGINVEAFDACSSARPPRLPFGHGLKQLLCKHGDKEE